MKTLLLMLCPLAMLSACCAPTGNAEPKIEYRTKVVDTGCEWTKPIYVSKADVLTDETAVAILAHNQSGSKLCGWKPKGK